MGGGGDLLALGLVGSAVVSAVVGSYNLTQRPKSGVTAAAVAAFTITGWAVGQGILVSTTDRLLAEFGFTLSLLMVALVAPFWYRFACQYTGRTELLTRRRSLLLSLGPTSLLVLLVTNRTHGLLYTDPRVVDVAGSLVFVHDPHPLLLCFYVYVYVVLGLANYILFQKFLGSRNVYRTRTFLLMADSVVLTLAHMASVVGLSPFPYTSLGPILFLVLGLLSLLVALSDKFRIAFPLDQFLSIFRHRSRYLEPVARDAVIEEIAVGVVVLDHENRIVDVNPMAKRILDQEASRVVGRPLHEITPPEIFDHDDLSFLESGVTGEFTGVWVDPPIGPRRCYDITLTTAVGDYGGRIALVEDVTDRERRKGRLEDRTAALERQNEQLEDFADIVSHDLRNPLTVAEGTLQLVEDQLDSDQYDRLERSHERMEAIIDDVLSLARQGEPVNETELLDLGSVADDAWGTVDTDDGTLDNRLKFVVEGDDGRLRAMFENLFRNAIEHGSTDETAVTVTVGSFENGFYVTDDGTGIPEDLRDVVLEKGVTSTTRGTGLGLSIVNTIVDAHGWDLDVTESETGGARFEVHCGPGD